MIEISVLGPLVISHKERQVSINSAQVRTLCALLALAAAQAIPVATLLSELYPDDPVKNSRNALQASATRLRRVLAAAAAPEPAPAIRATSGGYLMDLTPLAVDAVRFLALVKGASVDDLEPADSIRLLERALGLWRGPALSDVLTGSRVQGDQVRLTEMRLGAMESLAEARLRVGQSTSTIADLKRMVEIHPERERLSELLMVALYRSGQQTEALVVFGKLRLKLLAEFGIDPGRRMYLLQRAILNQDLELNSERILNQV